VDPPQAIAGHERANVRTLDAVPLRPRDLVADERLRLQRPEEPLKTLGGRIHPQLQLRVDNLLVHDQPEAVVRGHRDRAELVPTPPATVQRDRERSFLTRCERERARSTARELEARPWRRRKLEPRNARPARRMKLKLEVVSLRRPFALQLDGECHLVS